jgi:2-methylisocitrate lyase-like PEP mutase family enzyme
MTDLAPRRAAFRALHARGCFVIPNPWDVGSARLLAGMGFQALATTSGGFAHSEGLADGTVPLERMLEHVRTLVQATELPVNADFLDAYAKEPEGVAANVRRCVETGVAGLSVEDMAPDHTLYDSALALERVRAARAAIDSSGADVLLTARCEAFLVGHAEPLQEACRRLEAFAGAGADVLYAPGPRDAAAIRAVVSAVAPRPVNVLVMGPALSVAELAALGARRLSVGGRLAQVALGAFLRTARAIAAEGSFAGLAGAEPSAELNRFFRAWPAKA